MIIRTKSYRKPDLLLLLAFFVGVGLVTTGLVQAAEPNDYLAPHGDNHRAAGSEHWWQSIWGLDLARKLENWRPKISVGEVTKGFQLASPFGKTGPSLRFSSSLPDSVQRSLRDGGDRRIGAFGSDTDAFVFLQKRW